MDVDDELQDIYDNAVMRTNGHTVQYRSLELEKVDWVHPEHTEYAVYNNDGEKIESLTVNAFDSYDDFQNFLDEIADYQPDSMQDWLNREGENQS